MSDEHGLREELAKLVMAWQPAHRFHQDRTHPRELGKCDYTCPDGDYCGETRERHAMAEEIARLTGIAEAQDELRRNAEAARERLKRENIRLRAALRRLEWVHAAPDGSDHPSCIACGGVEPYHHARCWLKDVLSPSGHI